VRQAKPAASALGALAAAAPSPASGPNVPVACPAASRSGPAASASGRPLSSADSTVYAPPHGPVPCPRGRPCRRLVGRACVADGWPSAGKAVQCNGRSAQGTVRAAEGRFERVWNKGLSCTHLYDSRWLKRMARRLGPACCRQAGRHRRGCSCAPGAQPDLLRSRHSCAPGPTSRMPGIAG
jgi:hypothetical protein